MMKFNNYPTYKFCCLICTLRVDNIFLKTIFQPDFLFEFFHTLDLRWKSQLEAFLKYYRQIDATETTIVKNDGSETTFSSIVSEFFNVRRRTATC